MCIGFLCVLNLIIRSLLLLLFFFLSWMKSFVLKLATGSKKKNLMQILFKVHANAHHPIYSLYYNQQDSKGFWNLLTVSYGLDSHRSVSWQRSKHFICSNSESQHTKLICLPKCLDRSGVLCVFIIQQLDKQRLEVSGVCFNINWPWDGASDRSGWLCMRFWNCVTRLPERWAG